MRILIADDHDLLRDTLVLYLESTEGFQTATAADFGAAIDLIRKPGRFDLVLLDLNMPGMNGLSGLAQAIGEAGPRRVALMSGVATREVAERALAMGAAGFLPKTLPAKSLINAVRFMAMGEQYAPLEFMTAPQTSEAGALAEKLSQREMQVLRGLTEGKSNKQIARDLDLQEPTIKLHMKTLYRKIGAQNRTQAALIARDVHLF